MSVTVRPYVDGGWEVDIRVTLPDGSVLREREKRRPRPRARRNVGRSLASECCW